MSAVNDIVVRGGGVYYAPMFDFSLANHTLLERHKFYLLSFPPDFYLKHLSTKKLRGTPRHKQCLRAVWNHNAIQAICNITLLGPVPEMLSQTTYVINATKTEVITYFYAPAMKGGGRFINGEKSWQRRAVDSMVILKFFDLLEHTVNNPEFAKVDPEIFGQR